jgi:hypothetical protein
MLDDRLELKEIVYKDYVENRPGKRKVGTWKELRKRTRTRTSSHAHVT